MTENNLLPDTAFNLRRHNKIIVLDGATMRRRRVLHEARVMRSLATFSRPLQHVALSHKRVARLKHRLVAVAAVACK